MKQGKTLQQLAAEIERQYKSKKDYVASTGGALEVLFDARDREDEGGSETFGQPIIRLKDVGDFAINQIAHEQIGEHAGIPKKYYDRMLREKPDLLVDNVRAWFTKYPATRLVRTLDGGARAFLSDSYRPLDNYDFAGATLPILSSRKLTVMSCEITDKRLYIKAVDEQLFRDVPVGHRMGDGTHTIFDTCAPAVILSNSEVGFGRLVVDTGVYTRGCTNMALWAQGGMKRTHVGARHRIADGVDVADLDAIMSDATRRKTMEAMWMQVRDVLAAAFDEKTFDERIERLRAAADNKITGKVEKVVEVAAKTLDLNDGERESVFKHLIEGGALSQYGLHGAITRAAQDVQSYDRATEMEYLGGRVLELPRAEWERMQEAA